MPDELKVEQYESIEALSPELIAEWKELLDSCRNELPFSDPGWLKLWWKHFGSGCKLLIITVRVGEQLAGVLPFAVRQKTFFKQLTFMGYPQATHSDPAVRKEYADEAVEAVMGCLNRLSGTLICHFTGMEKGAAFTEKFINRIKNAGGICLVTETISPVIYPARQDFEEYYRRRINRGNRNQDKRCQSRLSKLGTLEFRALTPDDMPRVAELHRDRWKKKLDTSGFTKPDAREFYIELLDAGGERWSALTLGASLDQELVAFEYGYRCGGLALMYRSAYTDLLSVYAAGKMMHREIFRRCFDAGLHTVNLGVGFEELKKEWTDDNQTVLGVDFPSDDPLSRILLLFCFLKGSLRNWLKQNREIVLFKRNTLGKVKYFFSAENLRTSVIAFTESLKRLGLTGYLCSFKKKKRCVEYRFDLTDVRLLGAAGPRRTRKASLNDVREIAFFMNCSPKNVVRRFFRQEQCYVMEKQKEILCLAWISISKDGPRIFDCRHDRRRCGEQDLFYMFADILDFLQKQKNQEAGLELEAENRKAADAAGKAGFKCAGP